MALDKDEKREFSASLEYHEDTVVSGITEHIKVERTLGGSVAGTDTYTSGNLSGRVTTDKISTNVKASFKPDKISTVDTVINLNEDEQFAHKRAAPRARPSVDKKVTLHVQGRDSDSKTFVLFDLSRGGLSFTISGKDLFQKNDLLEVTAFDDKPVDPPMIGIIRSIREEGMDEFRVGVQFTNVD